MSKDLIDDANDKVVQLLIKKPVQSSFKSVQDDVKDCNAVKFVEDIQKLVVKVALIISEIETSHNFEDGDCLDAIKYLCKKILKENDLYKYMDAFVSNTDVSKIKQTEEKVNVIAAGANMYNDMIFKLASRFELSPLESIYITQQIGGAKKAAQPKPDKSDKVAKQEDKKDKDAKAAKQEDKKDKKEKSAKKEEKKDKAAKKEEKKDKKDKVAKKEEKDDKKDKVAKQAEKQEKTETAAKPTEKQEKNVETKKASAPQSSSRHDKSKASFVDETVGTLNVELSRGDGWYEKNLPKKDFFQCMLEINFEGKYELKSSQVVVNSLKVDNHEIKELIKSSEIIVKHGRNEIDVEIDRQGIQKFLEEKHCDNINRLPTQISVTVIATVKSGLTKMKKLPCDVSCVF